jgi:hypothetical protein
MGRVIDKEEFDDADYRNFSMRLQHCLIAMREVLTRPGFGVGEKTLGAELELALVDSDSRPLPANLEVLEGTTDPRVTVELDRFTMECNLTPGPLAGRPFSALGREIDEALREVRRAAVGDHHVAVAIAIAVAVAVSNGVAVSNRLVATHLVGAGERKTRGHGQDGRC